ncbi:MAG: 6-carboxytetrahydropterin synthase [Acidobacteria bacterium]|nr:6-carboxytetrahydropterin synthase [Acidobacteriota bacterium]
MIAITKAIRFCASHRYWCPEWSEEENRARFGKCVNIHGHNYRLEVTLCGEPDPVTGMIIDLKQVKNTLCDEVIERFDHQYLNEAIPHFRQHVPTTENLVAYLHEQLRDAFPGTRLSRIRLWEDIDLYAEWEADEPC